MAVSRRFPAVTHPRVTWVQHDLSQGPLPASPAIMLSFGPIALALEQLAASASIGRVIAISSASTLFKKGSIDSDERELMERIETDEQRLITLCEERDVTLSLLKTTMIYGGGDANVNRLRALINALPVAPVVGSGLRAPVHAGDLADLAFRLLLQGSPAQGVWLLEGGERLTYPNLLRRITLTQSRRLRVIPVPLWLMRVALTIAHRVGRLRDVKTAMLARQADDLVVDDSPAREQLGWNPRRFSP
jgi:nucleoside-diphosphate-sugar epimerase